MHTEILKRKAFEHFQRGQLKKAQSLYEKLCKTNANDAEALYMLGSTYGRIGNFNRARTTLEMALAKQPDAPPIICALGATYKALGDTDKAIASFKKALGLQPESPDIKLELAGLLMEQGKLSEAKSLLKSVIQKPVPDTTQATALHGLGEIFHLERKLDEAIDHYRRSIKSDPARPMTHNRLGHALHTLGRLDEAIHHYRTAIMQSPDLAVAHKNLASSLLTAGHLNEANAATDKALAIDPDYIDAITCKASILERQDDHAGAYKLISPLIHKKTMHPGLAIAFSNICSKVNACNDATDYLETLLKDNSLPDSTREQLHYAAGKLYDRLDLFKNAFEHFVCANNLRADSYSSGSHWAVTHTIIETFGPDFMENAPRATHGSRLPIFIVGMPRSGTSLTEQILSRHDNVFAAGELVEIEKQANIICASGDITFPICFRSVSQNTIDSAAENYIHHLKHLSADSKYVTDKMPQNFIFLGLINLLFPGARVIHCMRDPRDVCLSIYFQHFNESHNYATRLENIADYYLSYQRLMRHWKSVLDIPILDLRYEELVMSQETTSRRLLDFLDLEWDPRCLDFHRSDRHVATSSYDQVRQPLYTRSMGRWRQYREHIAPLLEVFGEAEIV